ncbi:S9 family peptidase [Leekyejoonella antrihumi]|uniref:S9 family peptidase n=1 Tax=Leekyejoonella antrihumi TaxID=1660198 RepID=A0A563DYD1_9MICO|nr:S9 family peptidase [Leekyejoonella antrihumi]
MQNQHPIQPPRAKQTDHVREHHGDRFSDPYTWLADPQDPQVISHLEAENAYAESWLEPLKPVADRLFSELRSHTQETDLTVPVRIGPWWYYSRTTEGAQYPCHCRAPYVKGEQRPVPDPESEIIGEQVLLDVNHEAQGSEFYQLGGLEISHDSTRMAVLYDVRGDERYALQARDLSTGAMVDEALTGLGYGLVWSRDGEYVFYTRADDAWRQHQVWRHRIGAPAEDDDLVLQEDDELFNVGIEMSSDERWLLVGARSATVGETWLLDLSDPTGELRSVQPRVDGLDYAADVDGEQILIVHNGDRADFDVATAPLSRPARAHWTPLLTGAEGERILGVQAFSTCLVISMRSNGLPTVRIIPKLPAGFGRPSGTGLDGETCTVAVGDNPAYDTDAVQLVLESYLTPRSVYDLEVTGGKLTLLKQRTVPGYDQKQYIEERVWVAAEDGVAVPVSLVRHRDVSKDGTNAGFLYGYGSYEISMDPYFSARRLSMLDRGVVCAVAHIRGGGEMGRSWYDSGKMLAKKNTFTDFVAAGRYLVDSGWVASDRLAAEGGSAGGLLIGAAVNLAPELFRAVHAAVPFVDALTTILDPSMPLTVAEWEEWGNPLADPDVYAYMKSYTPYENVRSTAYPAVLATTSLNDTRVMFTEPAKWVQVLRSTVTSDQAQRPILFKIEMIAGHGGKSGRYDTWRQVSEESAFLLDQIGATELLQI